MGMPLDSPASFWPISLTSCVSKLFERIILSRLLFFLESNSILSPRQAGFHPGRSTLDQILFLSQSISDEFNKPRQGSRMILSTIDFSKEFDSDFGPGGLPRFWGSMVFCHAPIPWKGSGNNNNNNIMIWFSSTFSCLVTLCINLSLLGCFGYAQN